jgi:hypothetical protein
VIRISAENPNTVTINVPMIKLLSTIIKDSLTISIHDIMLQDKCNLWITNLPMPYMYVNCTLQ